MPAGAVEPADPEGTVVVDVVVDAGAIVEVVVEVVVDVDVDVEGFGGSVVSVVRLRLKAALATIVAATEVVVVVTVAGECGSFKVSDTLGIVVVTGLGTVSGFSLDSGGLVVEVATK
jgi:hypothetical protein